jgi:hypothetical protein
LLLTFGVVILSKPYPPTGAAQVCEMRADIAARKVPWSKKVFRLVGRDVNNIREVACLCCQHLVSVLDEAVTVKVRVLQTNYVEILLGRAV